MRNRTTLTRLLTTLMLLFFCQHALAGMSGKEQMNHFLEKTRSLQANFSQAIMDSQRKRAVKLNGMFYLQRPGLFRWEYKEPVEQLIIADGKQIYMYDKELEQTSTMGQDRALKNTPAQVLSTDGKIEEFFEIIEIGTSVGFSWVELIPKDEESQFIRILLGFSDNRLQRMEMADKFGQIMRLKFTDMVTNPKLDKKLFQFEDPNRYDMIH
jgi:outer membrane lipoprotein carrier protein